MILKIINSIELLVADQFARHSFYMNNMKNLRAQARSVTRAAQGILGPRSLSRVVSDHIAFFEFLREGGATWDQIASLMASEGLRSRKGNVVNAGVLRALCSRAASHASSGRRRSEPNLRASWHATVEQRVTPPVVPTGSKSTSVSLAETIARTARIRGISSNEGVSNDET